MTSQRLFAGLPLPPALGEHVRRLIPGAVPGLRPTVPEDLHLTLHFLGAADAAPVADALGEVVAEAPLLKIGAPGCFRHRGGRCVLYLGIDATPALEHLHAAIGAALAVTGFRPEARAFRPHLTLARLDKESDAVIDAFLARPPPSIPAAVCPAFALFESLPGKFVPRYRILREFPLRERAAPG